MTALPDPSLPDPLLPDPSLPVDPVLLAPSPPCSNDDALAIAAGFGLNATAARDLGSERDRTFLLTDAAVQGLAVVKVSNSAESIDTLDMEADIVTHIGRVDPGLAVARPWRAPNGLHRLAWESPLGVHWARMYDVIAGHARHDPLTLSPEALGAWGTTSARLGRAMRSFAHPRAIRVLPWDVQHALRCRTMVEFIGDASTRAAVRRVLDRYEEIVLPRWAMLRAQVVHGDLTTDNVLLDDAGRVVGIIDFGDMSHTALVADIASLLDSLCAGRGHDDLLRTARLVLDGYQAITPLETIELELVGDLWATRTAIGIAIASWRAAKGLEDEAFAVRYRASAAAMLDRLLLIGPDEVRHALVTGHARPPRQSDNATALAARRRLVFGPAVESLSYDSPVHMARASGRTLS